MKSKPWNSIRRITAAASFATLAIAPLCQAQVNDPAQVQPNPVEARIRVRTDAESSSIKNDTPAFEFSPIPNIDGSAPTVNKGTLLDSRFHRFPRANPSASLQATPTQAVTIPVQAEATSRPFAPVAWQAPVTAANPSPRVATAPRAVTAAFVPRVQEPLPPINPQQQGQQEGDEVLAEFGPGSQEFEGLQGLSLIHI